MKGTSIFFATILLIWMSASTYWYVCKIKKDCNKDELVINTHPKNNPSKNIKTDTLNTIPVNESDTLDIYSKLLEGYVVSNFPKNSKVNNNINADFNVFAGELKKYISDNKNLNIDIIGYTDNSGSKKTNLLFGNKRALFIKDKLVKKGIDEKFFTIKSFGEEDPVVSNLTEEGRLKNRRVIIKINKK